ncbi:MAG: hypothetical protein NTW94_07630 [Legionellales bacterium]|nr:hypothetical protein [Legionellales bacterium]
MRTSDTGHTAPHFRNSFVVPKSWVYAWRNEDDAGAFMTPPVYFTTKVAQGISKLIRSMTTFSEKTIHLLGQCFKSAYILKMS